VLGRRSSGALFRRDVVDRTREEDHGRRLAGTRLDLGVVRATRLHDVGTGSAAGIAAGLVPAPVRGSPLP
jgi:hypothetical protein